MTDDEFYLQELPLFMSPSQNSDTVDWYSQPEVITTPSSKQFTSPEPISVQDNTSISLPANVQRYNYFGQEIKEADFSNSEAGIMPLDYLDTVGRGSSEAGIMPHDYLDKVGRLSLEAGNMQHDYLDTVGRGSSGEHTAYYYVNQSNRLPLLVYSMGPMSISVDSTNIQYEGDCRSIVIDPHLDEDSSAGKSQILISFRSDLDIHPVLCSIYTDTTALTSRGALGTRKNVSSENLIGSSRLRRLRSNSCSDLTEHRPSLIHQRNASASGSLCLVRRQAKKNGASGLLTEEEKKRIGHRRSRSMRVVLYKAPDEPILARSASDKDITTRRSHNEPAIDPEPCTLSLDDILTIKISPPSKDVSDQSLFESDVEKLNAGNYSISENDHRINALTVSEEEKTDHDVIREMKNNNHVESIHFPLFYSSSIKTDNPWIDLSLNEDRNKSLMIDQLDMETSDDATVQTPLFTHEETQSDDTHAYQKPTKSSKIGMTISLTIAVLSIFLYLADIGTDIMLAREYFMQNQFSLFWATVVFILVPSVLLAVVDLSWFYQDQMEHMGNNNTAYIVVRIVFGVASFGRIFRTVEYVYHGYKWIHATRFSDQAFHEDRSKEAARDYRLLDLINVFTESAPQFLLQLIITLYSHDVEFLRALSLATSWVSISWTLVSYYDSNRAALPGREGLTIQAHLTYLMAKLSEVSSRIVSVSLFIFVFKIWGVSILLHFVIMAVWVFCIQKPELEGIAVSNLGKALYKLFFSYVLLVCYINLRNDPTLYRMIFYHTLTYTENFAMGALILWQMTSQEELGDNYKLMFLIAIPLGFFFHIIFQVFFYRCCHSWSDVSTKRRQNDEVIVNHSNEQTHDIRVTSIV